MLQRLAVVAVRGEGEVLHHLGHFVPHQGDVARIGAVGSRGPQAQEAALADQFARRAEVLDADVVQKSRSMHRGLKIRLGDQRQLARAALPPDVAGEDAAAAVRMPVAGPQNSEPGRVDGFERFAAGRTAQPILAISQEREMAVLHPRQQRLGFTDVPHVETRTQRIQIVGCRRCCLAHLRPIRAGDAYIAHAAFDLRLQRTEDAGIHDAIHFDVLKRLEPASLAVGAVAALLQGVQLAGGVPLHRKNRMRQEVQRE